MIAAKKVRIPAAERPYHDALHKTYPEREFLVIPQVRFPVDGEYRVADALVAGLWESRDTMLRGFEIKTSPQSLVQELKNPEKADLPARFCDTWTVLAPHGMLRSHQLPAKWGLFELHDGYFMKTKEPEPLAPREFPRAVFASILQGVLSQADAKVRHPDIVKAYKDGVQEGRRKGREGMDAMARCFEDRLKQKDHEREDLARLVSKIGIVWNSRRRDPDEQAERAARILKAFQRCYPDFLAEDDVIEAIQYVAAGGLDQYRSKLNELRSDLKNLLEDVDRRLSGAGGKGPQAP